MSKVFYDHLVSLEDLEKLVKSTTETPEEKEELWVLVDEIVHHRVIGCVLDHLPHEHHIVFMKKLEKMPYDRSIMDFVIEKIDGDIEAAIKEEVMKLTKEILKDLQIAAN